MSRFEITVCMPIYGGAAGARANSMSGRHILSSIWAFPMFAIRTHWLWLRVNSHHDCASHQHGTKERRDDYRAERE